MAFKRSYFDGPVTSPQIVEGAVTEDKIADNAVTSAKIKDETITGADIGAGQVQTADIADGAVTQAKLGPDVSIVPLEDNAVSTAKIQDGAVITQKIANGAVTSDKIQDAGVTSTKIADGVITNAKIATNAITQSKLASNSVGASEIIAGAVGTSEIANGAVTAAKLDPAIVLGGDRFVFGTLGTPGMQSADVFYLTDISADIPYTVIDLSAWVPATAKAVLLQLGVFNQAFTSGRAFFRVRTNVDQRDSMGVGMIPGQNSMSANQGISPITASRTIEYALESVGGPWVGTLTLWITVIGYIV
ncbi:MAG: hypothetical protein A2496_22000 [Burkholderiales bacterium RIFOXYC12_FULL_60_6]|nr:MAG: hypothetical protein A2496_22000 [Burkholderiales bacterium RIFOXYC12_FULL_60_6]